MAAIPSSRVPPAPSADYNGNKLIIFTGLFIPVQIICVALRYLARYMIKGPWGLDDLLILTSLILQLCQAGVDIGAVRHAGVGYHVAYLEVVAPEKLTNWGKYLTVIEFLYLGGINIPKLSILALYRRLFPQKGIRLVIHVLMGMLIALGISTVMAAIVQCIPFAANWNPEVPGARCINKEALFVWESIPNIVTDVIILILPMRIVWNLHTSTRLKIGLTFTFVVGSLGLVTSIVRFTTFFRKSSFIDGTWAATELIIWTEVEVGVYLISACLLTYRPFLERIGQSRIVTKFTHSGHPKSATDHNSNNGRTASPMPLKSGSGIRDLRVGSQGFYRLGDKNMMDQRKLVSPDIQLDQFGDDVNRWEERC